MRVPWPKGISSISCRNVGPRRFYTSPTPSSAAPPTVSRIDRLISRTPKFLRPTVSGLRNAPVTHVTAFLLLHELTAVIPLFALAGTFHYYRWLPPFFAEGDWILGFVEKFGRYAKRKGWIAEGEKAEVERMAREGEVSRVEGSARMGKWWDTGEGGMRWVVEFATAYAVTKALLPIRLVLSVWGAPWFARWAVVPASNAVKRLWRRGKGA